MLGENLQTIMENREIFIKASKDICLNANSEKTKYMLTSCQQYVVQKMLLEFVYWKCGKVQIFGSNSNNNTNSIHEEIKQRIKMENACWYSVDKILTFCLLSKKLSVNTYKTIILSVVLYGWETRSVTLREKHRLSVLNKVLRMIFRAKRD